MSSSFSAFIAVNSGKFNMASSGAAAAGSSSNMSNNGGSSAASSLGGAHSGYASPAASVTSADIAADFANLTQEEQEKQRAEWSRVIIK